MPTDKHATVYVELLDTDEVKEILRVLGNENKRLREALYRACVQNDMPEGVVLNHEDGTAQIDGEA